jgi:predicted RNase H-like HicB family nuclease
MAEYFPVVVEREDNGTFSAFIAGLPGVYAAADTAAVAKRSIRIALADHLRALHELGQAAHANAQVAVLRYTRERDELDFTGLGALLGRKKSADKAEAARRNGRMGGRPRKTTRRTSA